MLIGHTLKKKEFDKTDLEKRYNCTAISTIVTFDWWKCYLKGRYLVHFMIPSSDMLWKNEPMLQKMNQWWNQREFNSCQQNNRYKEFDQNILEHNLSSIVVVIISGTGVWRLLLHLPFFLS